MMAHEFLQNYLSRKKTNNPSYSLRALARDLKLSVSFVSAIMTGKKTPSAERLQRICDVLEIDEFGKQQLQLLFGKEILKKKRIDTKTFDANQNQIQSLYQPSNRKVLDFLSPWYYPAILDLSTCENFQSDPAWIAHKLGLKIDVARIAIEQLLNAGLLEQNPTGELCKSQLKLRIPTRESKMQIRRYHTEMMARATRELNQKTQEKDFKQRLISGITTAASPEKIQQAKERLNDVLHEIADFLSDGDCTEVFQINLQLFPLTRT